MEDSTRRASTRRSRSCSQPAAPRSTTPSCRRSPSSTDRPRERAAIVLITDGADTASDTTLQELRPALVRSDAFVYAIAIDTPEPQAIAKQVNVNTLNEITGQSGGRTEVVRATADLDGATSRIAEELNSQYVLAYASPNPGDGKYHSIRVRTTDPTHKVRARSGYVAARDRSAIPERYPNPASGKPISSGIQASHAESDRRVDSSG